jgi:kynurenine--oxoglutarate transaminase/cysteine-S-conjugate beta-lyase/glutamine--phenylpyruvate transaminase
VVPFSKTHLLLKVQFFKELARIESSECYFKTIAVDLQERRDLIASILEEAGMTPVIPEGGYFIMADWSPHST